MTDPTRKLTADDFAPEIQQRFDRYVRGALDWRGFLDGASRFAVGDVTAAGLLEALSPNFAAAEQVLRGDPRTVDFSSPQGRGTAAATSSSPRERRRSAGCRWSSSCTRTAASIRTSRTSRAGSRSTVSSPSRPTRSSARR